MLSSAQTVSIYTIDSIGIDHISITGKQFFSKIGDFTHKSSLWQIYSQFVQVYLHRPPEKPLMRGKKAYLKVRQFLDAIMSLNWHFCTLHNTISYLNNFYYQLAYFCSLLDIRLSEALPFIDALSIIYPSTWWAFSASTCWFSGCLSWFSFEAFYTLSFIRSVSIYFYLSILPVFSLFVFGVLYLIVTPNVDLSVAYFLILTLLVLFFIKVSVSVPYIKTGRKHWLNIFRLRQIKISDVKMLLVSTISKKLKYCLHIDAVSKLSKMFIVFNRARKNYRSINLKSS